MLKRFYPNAYVSSFRNIGPAFFLERGINGIILDLDNTIIPWQASVLEPDMVELLGRFKEAGLKLCVVSNALNRRVAGLLEPLGIAGVARAAKPRRRSFFKALEILGTVPEETAVVGDQLFTDILGGNRLGLYTVLVKPVSKKEFVGTRFVRLVEKVLLYRLAKEGLVDAGGHHDQQH